MRNGRMGGGKIYFRLKAWDRDAKGCWDKVTRHMCSGLKKRQVRNKKLRKCTSTSLKKLAYSSAAVSLLGVAYSIGRLRVMLRTAAGRHASAKRSMRTLMFMNSYEIEFSPRRMVSNVNE